MYSGVSQRWWPLRLGVLGLGRGPRWGVFVVLVYVNGGPIGSCVYAKGDTSGFFCGHISATRYFVLLRILSKNIIF